MNDPVFVSVGFEENTYFTTNITKTSAIIKGRIKEKEFPPKEEDSPLFLSRVIGKIL